MSEQNSIGTALRRELTRLLYEHSWEDGECMCGWTSPADVIVDHVDHQADVLLAALAAAIERPAVSS